MASRGLRVAVIGATGAFGSEVLVCLDGSSLPIAELVPVATDDSLGEDIEFRGELYPVETELRSLRGLDLVFLCAPAGPSLDFAREALHAQADRPMLHVRRARLVDRVVVVVDDAVQVARHDVCAAAGSRRTTTRARQGERQPRGRGWARWQRVCSPRATHM